LHACEACLSEGKNKKQKLRILLFSFPKPIYKKKDTTFEKKSMVKAYSNLRFEKNSFLKRAVCAARDTSCA